MSYEVIILTLVIETLTSHVIQLTILAKILTSHPYNFCLLKLRMSVFETDLVVTETRTKFSAW